ncbi:uncharacterized protein LOC109708770 [Ananas comosus]|uniref:Uncharacterized protein LOC109708770 n=1 Tax=Ananas comosus TaxID=4615 RepID=A0A6P5ER39_ANACO|nr:uncharacterized protein LOC109708770 [Ananas comosus]
MAAISRLEAVVFSLATSVAGILSNPALLPAPQSTPAPTGKSKSKKRRNDAVQVPTPPPSKSSTRSTQGAKKRMLGSSILAMPAPISAIKAKPEIGKERSRSSSKFRKDAARQKIESPPKAPKECLKNRTPGRGKRFRSPYNLRPRWGAKNKTDETIADPSRSGHPPAPRPLNICEENVEEYAHPKADLFAGDSFMISEELHNIVIEICEDVAPLSSIPEVSAAGAPVAATATEPAEEYVEAPEEATAPAVKEEAKAAEEKEEAKAADEAAKEAAAKVQVVAAAPTSAAAAEAVDSKTTRVTKRDIEKKEKSRPKRRLVRLSTATKESTQTSKSFMQKHSITEHPIIVDIPHSSDDTSRLKKGKTLKLKVTKSSPPLELKYYGKEFTQGGGRGQVHIHHVIPLSDPRDCNEPRDVFGRHHRGEDQ